MCEPENYGLYGQIALEFLTLLSSFQGFFSCELLCLTFPQATRGNVTYFFGCLMEGVEQDLCQNKDLFRAHFVL